MISSSKIGYKDASRQNQLQASTFGYREAEISENKENSSNMLNGQEINCRKRKMFGGPPKPDSPVSVNILNVAQFYP